MKIAVAVINGLGSQDQFYSVELKHRIVEEYLRLAENRNEDDLIFQEIYWGDLLGPKLKAFIEQANYQKDLSYLNLRQHFVDVLGATLACMNTEQQGGFYQALKLEIASSLNKLANHRRVDREKTPLVLMAHSFGSIAMTNYLFDIQQRAEPDANLSPIERLETLAGLVTFGSPLGVLSFAGKDAERPISKVGSALPEEYQQRVKWLNFYDKDDIIAYPLKALNDHYEKVVDQDIEINVGGPTTSWNPNCHNGYWEDKDFYKPVAHYLSELTAPHVFWQE